MLKRLLACLALVALAAPAAAQDYREASAATSAVAEAYFEAYIARDWDRLEGLLADDASFKDPTAALVFGGEGAQGKAAMMENFRTGYASITAMDFVPHRLIVGGTVALFEGDLTWTALHRGGVPVTATLPFVVMLELADGKVVAHRDYADYTPYLEARAAALGD